MVNKRFSSKAGEEYEFFKLGCPHFEELENNLGDEIKNIFKNSSVNEINVLEVGCGPGYTTLIILDSDDRIKIVSVDNEHIMIEQAKEILKKYINNKRVELVEEDALKFVKSQKSNSFDVFASGFTLHNFLKNYRKKIISEIYRILKPGGIFLNADKYSLNNKSDHMQSLNWQLNKFEEIYSKINRPDLVKEWTDHYLEDNKQDVIMNEYESIKIMREAGFIDQKIIFRKQMDMLLFAKK